MIGQLMWVRGNGPIAISLLDYKSRREFPLCPSFSPTGNAPLQIGDSIAVSLGLSLVGDLPSRASESGTSSGPSQGATEPLSYDERTSEGQEAPEMETDRREAYPFVR